MNGIADSGWNLKALYRWVLTLVDYIWERVGASIMIKGCMIAFSVGLVAGLGLVAPDSQGDHIPDAKHPPMATVTVTPIVGQGTVCLPEPTPLPEPLAARAG